MQENNPYSITADAADAYDNVLMRIRLNEALAFAMKKIEAWFIYKNEKEKVADAATRRFYKMFVK